MPVGEIREHFYTFTSICSHITTSVLKLDSPASVPITLQPVKKVPLGTLCQFLLAMFQ